RALPRSRALPLRAGGNAVRGTEADAVHCPRPRESEPPPPDRRAVEGPGADHRRAFGRGAPGDEAGRDDPAGRAEPGPRRGGRRRLRPPRRRPHRAGGAHGRPRRRPGPQAALSRDLTRMASPAKTWILILGGLAFLLAPLLGIEPRTYLTLTVAGLA